MKKFGAEGATRGGRAKAPDRDAYADPYRHVARPSDRTARGATVTLDPDVARVFRGDAAVNKALRLVIQLIGVAAPRSPAAGRDRAQRPRPAYQGSDAARGFKRKARSEES